MNRPNINDYETKAMLDDQELKIKVDLSNFGYLRDLEKYCDVLEKALDKACIFFTECNNDCMPNCPFINEDSCRCKCADENAWKEWLLKDE